MGLRLVFRHIASAVIIHLLFGVTTCRPACAAQITVLTHEVHFPDEPGCTVKFTGEITAGDLNKLQSAFVAVNNRTTALAGYLCLHSPGGSYEEGLRIADWMLDQNIFTVIQANDVCYSACAIIFMTGGDFEDGRSLERYLHPAGTLGFHAPYVTGVPNRVYDKRSMETMFQMGIQAIRDLTRLGLRHNAPRNFLPPSLIAEMLGKGPNEAFIVNTIYKVVRLDIRLFGYRKPKPTINGYGNACVTVVSGERSEISLDKPPNAWNNQGVERSKNELWFGSFGAEGSEYCVVQLMESVRGIFKVSRTPTPLHHTLRTTDLRTGHPWFLYAPATLIRATQ